MLNGRKRLVSVLTGLALAGAIGLVPGAAQADEIGDVRAKVDRLYHEAEVAQERYHDAKLELDELQRDLDSLEATVDEIEQASKVAEIASVQNLFNLTNRQSHDVLDYCTSRGIAFIPWFPIANGDLAKPGGAVDHVVQATGATPAQVALAWLLAVSPVVLPIPGTKSIAHLEENVAAVDLTLTDAQVKELTEAV